MDVSQGLLSRGYGPRPAELRSISSQKRTRSISNHLSRTRLAMKGFMTIMAFGIIFFLRNTAGSPKRAR